MEKEVARTQIKADGFTIDVIILDSGRRVIPEEEMKKFLVALENNGHSDKERFGLLLGSLLRGAK